MKKMLCFQKKRSIIDDLKSKEMALLDNVQKNPKQWNHESLEINFNLSKSITLSINVAVTITQVSFLISNAYDIAYF